MQRRKWWRKKFTTPDKLKPTNTQKDGRFIFTVFFFYKNLFISNIRFTFAPINVKNSRTMKVKTSPHACMQEYISRDVQDYAMHRGFCIFMEHYTYPEGTFVIEMQGKTEIAVYNWMQALTFLERYLSVYLMTSEQRVYWEEVQRLIREHKR